MLVLLLGGNVNFLVLVLVPVLAAWLRVEGRALILVRLLLRLLVRRLVATALLLVATAVILGYEAPKRRGHIGGPVGLRAVRLDDLVLVTYRCKMTCQLKRAR